MKALEIDKTTSIAKEMPKHIINENLTWEMDGLSLFTKNKLIYNQKDKEILSKLMGLNLVPLSYYKEIWWIGSGAKRQMDNHPHYYKNITENYPSFIPSPYENQINLDLKRSYPEEAYFEVQENLTKLKNVLLAYSRRNAVVGYCQGFNFIVGKLLLEYDSEEKVFWIFAQIIEEYLPPDFYTQIGGAQLDSDAINDLVDLKVGNYINTPGKRIIILGWIIKLFAQCTNGNALNLIWTAFFLKGMVAIYITATFFFFNICTKNDLRNSLDRLRDIFNKEIFAFNELDKLRNELFNRETGITLNTIENWRNTNRDTIYEDCILNIDSKDYFLKNSLIDLPQCDLDWPLCIYDRKYRFEVPLFTVLLCKTAPVFIDDFFFLDCGKETGKESKYDEINSKLMNPIMKKIRIYSDLLLERRQHHCSSQRHFSFDIYRIINTANKELYEKELDRQFERTQLASVYFEDTNREFFPITDQAPWVVIDKKNENNKSEGIDNNIPLSRSIYL